MLRWLVKREIVEALPTTCGQGGNGMAYAIGPGARRIAQRPELLPYGQAHNGLEIITHRCIYMPTRSFLEEAGCAECRREVGVPLFDRTVESPRAVVHKSQQIVPEKTATQTPPPKWGR